jgi:NCAIR mutase (PurE)-related protein
MGVLQGGDTCHTALLAAIGKISHALGVLHCCAHQLYQVAVLLGPFDEGAAVHRLFSPLSPARATQLTVVIVTGRLSASMSSVLAAVRPLGVYGR